MKEIDEIKESAIFGERVKMFLESDVGQYVLGQLESEMEEQIDKLKTVHPWRWRRISQLQAKIEVYENFKFWLANAIIDGQQAMKILQGDEE